MHLVSRLDWRWGGAVAVAAGLLVPSVADAAVWGSFDVSRINYADGCLNCMNKTMLVELIEANGDIVAMGTPELTSEYLDLVDVFYTSMLSSNTGDLSAGEQTALQEWIAGGGTLIVTAEFVTSLGIGPAYETFTSTYGVTNYAEVGESDMVAPTGMHPIVNGVTMVQWDFNATFEVGKDAAVLGNDAMKNLFMAVLEPDTEFCEGGRIFVIGDHNIFANPFIAEQDNTLLADNLIDWAATSFEGCPGDTTGTDGTSTGGDTTTGDDTTGGSSTTIDPGDVTTGSVTTAADSTSGDDTMGTTTGTPMGSSGDGMMTTAAMGGSTTGDDESGGTEETPTDDGCSCRSRGSSSPTWLLFAIAAWSRRRSRQRRAH